VAKFIIVLFLSLTTGLLSYLTYTGTAQEKIETLETQSVRSNSYRSSINGGSSYNSSSYGYGK